MSGKQSPPADVRHAGLDDTPGDLGDLLRALGADAKAARQASERVFIYGPEGSGKSHAAAALMNAWTEAGQLCFWLDCFDIPGSPMEADEVLETVAAAPVLFIDDLGKEPAHIRPKMRKLFQARLTKANAVTVYTANLDIDPEDREDCALSELYGPSIRSRLIGSTTLVRYTGKDRRLA